MDDRYILAFSITNPFSRDYFLGRKVLLRIWHRDPRTPGHPDPSRHGDVAGWISPRLTASEVAFAEHLAGKDNEFDNLEYWFPGLSLEERAGRIKQIFRLHKRHARPWWKHPRWQFWNWRLSPKD